MGKNQKLKLAVIIGVLLALWGILYLFGHSAIVSGYLKGFTEEQLHRNGIKNITVGKVYLNIFPLNLELREVSLGDERGEGIFSARTMKLYPSVWEIIRKRFKIARIAVSEADLRLTDTDLTVIRALGSGGAGGGLGVEVGSIDVRKSKISYRGRDVSIESEGVRISAVLSGNPSMNIRVPKLHARAGAIEIRNMSVKGMVSLRESMLTIRSLHAASEKSSADFHGTYSIRGQELSGDLKANLDVVELGNYIRGENLKNGNVLVQGKLHYSNKALTTEMKVSGGFYIETLMSSLNLTVPIRGFTKFSGAVTIHNNQITGRADAELVKGHLYGIDVDRATVTVVYDGKELTFTNGKASVYGGTAEVNVALAMPTVETFMVAVDVDKVNAKDLLKLIGLELPLPLGVVTGSLRTEGHTFSPEGWFIAHFNPETGTVMMRISTAKGKFSAQGDQVRLQSVEIKTLVSTANFSGEMNTRDNTLSISGTANTGDMADIVKPYTEDVRGYGFGSYTVSGKLNDPDVAGIIRITDIGYGKYTFNSLESVFRYNAGNIIIKNMTLASGGEKHTISGSIRVKDRQKGFNIDDVVFDLKADIHRLGVKPALELFGYSLPVDGFAAGNVWFSGTIHDVKAQAHVKISPVSVYGYDIDSVESDVLVEKGVFSFPEITAVKEKSVVAMNLRINREGAYEVRIPKGYIQVSHLPFKSPVQQGVIEFTAEGKGMLSDPVLTARAKLVGFMAENVPLGYGDMRVVLEKKTLSLSGELFDRKCSLTGTVSMTGDYPWKLNAAFQRGAYDIIAVAILKEIPEDLMFNLEGKLQAWGDRYHVDGFVDLDTLNISMYGYNFSNASNIRLALKDRQVTFDKFGLKSGEASLSIKGSVVPLQRLDLMIDGDTFLAPLKRLFKSIEAIKGKGSFVLSIRGQWETPLINGGITFQDASLGIKDFPYRMYDLKSYLYIDDNRFVIEDLSGKIGGGDMSLRGYGYVKGFTVDKFYLDTELHDVTFKFTRGFMTTLSGNLVYRGDQGKYTLVGQAAILQARYTERIDWGAQILKSRVQEKPKGTLTPFQQTELNIKVDGDKNIVIDNNIARTSLKLDLLLRGTVAKPILFGRIETEKGSVYFRKNKFDIIHASADFIDQEKINPYYDISALTVVKGYNIRITLEGQLERFNLALLSDPPLDQTDILSLLTVGELGSGKKKGIEGEMGTSEATSFITSAYQNAVEERLTSITGFDRFEVEPYIEDKTGSISPKFTVAKRLIGDKLYLTYSSTVGTDQADVIKVEYQLDKNTSLVGFQESTGSLGGDIKFRFEFR